MAEVASPMGIEHLPPVTPEESQLGKEAMNEFDRNKLDACNAKLSRLSQTRGSDPKVVHNKAVVQYYKSGLRRTDEFKKVMENVCERMRMNLDSADQVDDFDQCTVYYNHCVILYRLQQYHQAIGILSKIFQFVDPMDKLTQRVVLLLTDLYLCTQQPEKAMGMITYAEKNLLNGKVTGGDSEKEAQQPAKETKESAALEALRNRVTHLKIRCSLMLKNLKSAKREVKSLSNSQGNSVAMIYIKANLEYLRGNYRKAIKVLNTNPSSQRPTHETGEHVPTMYYNNLGVLHFSMHKHNLGAFYFRKALNENTQIVNEFHKGDLSNQLSGRPLQTLSVNRHHQLLYNMGVQLLHCGHPAAAFDCLIETMILYHVSPRLWLRLAECCIMSHRNGNEEDKKLSNRLKVVQTSVGSGVHKKLVLGPGFKDDDKRKIHESSDTPNTTLEFASLCLKNALCLLSCNIAPQSEVASPIRPGGNETLLVPAPPGNPMRPTEVENLRCSVLASSAYVALCLNDPVMALRHARALLEQARISGAHRYLAAMYIAEAQVAQDHIADAIQQLNPDTVADVSTAIPELKQDSEKSDKNGESEPTEAKEAQQISWYPRDVAAAKCLMQYNLATCHSIRGEYEKSLQLLEATQRAMGSPLPAQMVALNIYLQLMEGRRKSAQRIIKEHFGHISASRPGA